ncbi:hypothetical protein NQ314_020416 [Rhamnusium bicolor]|uniref:Protein FAM114A2 n=1 Tax=Rhamnusium bicolor TaxID=1586634 RepID=A0AAV8WKW4_9CUCU|nr:hypothetical protein NQ314_020416 [Rhamnusium bicolor]
MSMETSDSEYFESADEDFYSSDESDKNKAKNKDSVEINSDTRSETINKLNNLHLQYNEESTRCVSKINKNITRGEIGNDLINENLKAKSVETSNIHNENIKNEIIQITAADRAIIEVEDNMNLNAEINNMKEEITIRARNTNGDQMSKSDEVGHLNEKVHDSKGAVDTEPKIEFDLWNEKGGWGVDTEKDEIIQEDVWKNETDWVVDYISKNAKVEEHTNNLSDAVEENAWNNDEWEPVDEEKVDHDKTDVIKKDSNSSTANDISFPHAWAKWGNWGVSSVLSTASQSVSTLTTSVSQGISTVLETSIGVPDPEQLARLIHSEKKQNSDQNQNNLNNEEFQNKNSLRFGFGNIGNLVSGVSKLVETTSTKVISGGLDTLETIGKKTMEVLQEGDPGLKKKRAFLKLSGEKPVLSQVLREAKNRVEQENEMVKVKEKHFAKKMNYETLFDDHQGLVHLEALEMLSKQCEVKLQTLIESCTGVALTEIQETIDQVKELCELPDEDENEQMSLVEIKERLQSAVEEININITYDRLISTWEETDLWLNKLQLNICDERELHQQAIDTLAKLTALAVEQFHKTGELLFIKDHHSTADEADSLVQ